VASDRLAFAAFPEHISSIAAKSPCFKASQGKIETDFKFCFCLLKSRIMVRRRAQ
jgi:hypothetical protein